MTYTAKIFAALVLVVIALVGGYSAGNKAGAARVQAEWTAEKLVISEQRVKDEQAARAEEQRRAKAVQAVVDEMAGREAVSRDRAARAERTVVGLRDEIARLNGRAAPSDPGAAGFAHEARVARELLGSCTKEYGSVAAAADQLRDQVTGLQGWARSITNQGGSPKQ